MTDSQANASAKKILIVDDDTEIVESIRYALEANGYEVVVARDGNQGLALAERENPNLMILDMMMPKRSGFLVLEKLRRVREEPLPVIMITGNEGSRHKAYAELLGVNDYIRKPFAMDKLNGDVDQPGNPRIPQINRSCEKAMAPPGRAARHICIRPVFMQQCSNAWVGIYVYSCTYVCV